MEYGPKVGATSIPAIDDTMMMRPLPLATMAGTAAWVTASEPNTLTSKMRRMRSMGTSAMGPVWPRAALLISTSMSRSATRATSSVVMSSLCTRRLGASAARASA